MATSFGRDSGALIETQGVAPSRPRDWLSRGWRDLRARPGPSIAHGLLISGLGLILLAFGRTHPYFFAAAVSGFLLIGPIMTAGVCELSRRHARGESVSFDASLDGLTRNRGALTEFAVMLLAVSVGWFVLAEIILRLALGAAPPGIWETLWDDALRLADRLYLVSFFAVGAMLAVFVFVVSVVSVPMIIDRPVSARTAMRTSSRAVRANLPAMLLWALLIALLVAIGFATLLVGMILIVPLLGHATWHAYEDLVGRSDSPC